MTDTIQHYNTAAHQLVRTFDDPSGSDWPDGFIEALDDVCVNKETDDYVVRWEFRDGSAIVEINGFWDYGIHCDHLEAAYELIDDDDDDDNEIDLPVDGKDPLFIWPECHHVIPAIWQEAPSFLSRIITVS